MFLNNIRWFLIILIPVFSFAQIEIDSIKNVNVKMDTINFDRIVIEFDSLTNRNIYYEIINPHANNVISDNNLKKIISKVIKGNNYYKTIENGSLSKMITGTNKNLYETITIYNNVDESKIILHCRNNSLEKIEKWMQKKIVFEGYYGAKVITNSYTYTNYGYLYQRKYNGKVSVFKVTTDDQMNILLKEELNATQDNFIIAESENGLYVMPPNYSDDNLFGELKCHCK
jgi:hypothetical protein